VADVPDSGTMIDRLMPQANQYLDKIATALQEDGWQVQTEAVVGEPAYAIIEKSEELNVDAIVMSTHGRSGISRWLFGSVTSKVLGSVDRPVFVIPSRES
jgi:nucleotide-binding universal stress UspA family protein